MESKTLLLPLLIAFFASADAETAPAPQACRGLEALVSGGVELPAATLGLRLRGACQYEAGLRAGLGPDLYTWDARFNYFAEKADGSRLGKGFWQGGTWFWGPEFFYYNENGANGFFRLGYLNLMMGREHWFTRRWRWSYEWGGGLLVYERFRGGGPPIILPIYIQGRLEILGALF